MPQVPTSFVPQVGVSGEGANVQFVAPGVAPMQNLAAEQQIELGRTTQSVGQTLWRIGQIMTDDINSARAKQADTQFLDAANEILRGKQGYMYSRGQDAETQFQAAQDALAERAPRRLPRRLRGHASGQARRHGQHRQGCRRQADAGR